MKNKHKDPWYLNPFIDFILLLLIVITTPAIVNKGLDSWNFHSAPNLDNSNWLGFWGSYIGSSLGVLATLVAFSFTYYQNNKQNKELKEQNEQIQEQNKLIMQQNIDARELAKKQMRLQALPFINAKDVPNYNDKLYHDPVRTFNNDGHLCPNLYLICPVIRGNIRLTNIGVGPAIGVTIPDVDLMHFSVSESKDVLLEIPSEPGYLELPIKYSDREERQYTQTLKLAKKADFLVSDGITPPVLVEDQQSSVPSNPF